MIKAFTSAILAILCGFAVTPRTAQAVSLVQETEYRIAIGGLPVARAVFNTRIEEKKYSISGHVNTSGLADLIADIDARTSVTGTLAGGVIGDQNRRAAEQQQQMRYGGTHP